MVRFVARPVVDLRGPNGLGPVVGPVKVFGMHGPWPGIPADHHAVDHASYQREEAKNQEDNTQNPEKKNKCLF